LRHVLIYFVQLIRLSYDSGTETTREPRAEAAREQGDYYDHLFTYKEGDEASYFVVSEDSRGDAADVGPSGAGTSKGSPMASNSIGWTTEASTSEGEPAVPPTSTKNFPMEPDRIDVAAEEVRRETAAEAAEAVSLLGNTLICCEQFSPDIHYALLNKVLPQVFRLWVYQLQGSQLIFLRESGVSKYFNRNGRCRVGRLVP